VGTKFVIDLVWDGKYTEECYSSFNLFANDALYQLAFRINAKNDKNTLRQLYQIKNQWKPATEEPLNLKEGINKVVVNLDEDFFRAKINGKLRKVSVPMLEAKMAGNYKEMRIPQGNCLTINMDTSYVIWDNTLLTHGFSKWSDWSDCSTDNGVGVQKRTRSCESADRSGCVGETEEEAECRRGLCFTGPMETETKQFFNTFKQAGEKSYSYRGCRKPKVGTKFVLDVVWNGKFEEECGLSFNIMANDNLYRLDFRVNYKGQKDILAQGFQLKNKWQPSTEEALSLKEGRNTVVVNLDEDFFKTKINGKLRKVAIQMLEAKMAGNYKEMRITKSDCIAVDFETSYVIWDSTQ